MLLPSTIARGIAVVFQCDPSKQQSFEAKHHESQFYICMRAVSVSSFTISRPSPAAMASKQGSSVPALVKHCSPTADVMPLATRHAILRKTRTRDNIHLSQCMWWHIQKSMRENPNLTNMNGPGSAKSATELIPKYPQDMGARMLIVTAFTFNGASNMNVSTYVTSALELGCQH